MHTGTSISAANSTCLSLLPAVQVEPRELVVPAGGEASVLVRVLLDDAAAFKDTLHVLVSEGADVPVALDATGVGDTVVSAALSQPQLDFGPQFVGRGWQTEVEVTNMGRKPVTLTWTNRRLAEVMDTLNKAAKAAGTLCWWQPACRAATVCRKHRRLIATRMPTAQQPVPTERSSVPALQSCVHPTDAQQSHVVYVRCSLSTVSSECAMCFLANALSIHCIIIVLVYRWCCCLQARSWKVSRYRQTSSLCSASHQIRSWCPPRSQPPS